MGLIAKETGSGSSIEPIPEGTYEAVCYAVIDLGTHYSETFKKEAHKVLIQWEIPECRITVERDGKDVDLPRVISRRYTMSLHKKAALRHDLEAWRGKAFTEDELAGFDVSTIVGHGCLLGIVHEEGKEGKVYAGISSILALPRVKGRKPAAPENEPLVFSIPEDAGPRFAVPETLPDWIVQTIKESREWTGKGQRPAIQPPTVVDEKDVEISGNDEEMPF